ncbi:hypothetical protein pEaSNUABM22_00263 [Erwinia phage pEa_SNUABM_22]|uniref:Uncharacterized protein n=1 Tax=Erwinia phage pEa_SNUABM_22 TaxID=2869549 RepID=A0AAE8XQG9_9CAUD|nr:hypothetical protein MPK63_gp262 [Erwinia phage pEa_SNUABM_22]UAW96750.1 hypothetical protein pEaSNUABM22_00263 [Erwinia phage pEa_SNUABM_22]
MGNLTRYVACIELSTREGNMNLPILPRCELQAFVLDGHTQTKVPIKLNATNVINVAGKTCGSLQWFDCVNLLIWSSFDPGRFTLYIERAFKTDETTDDQQSAELCK